MQKQNCQTCSAVKTAVICDRCSEHTCKRCSFFIDDTVFDYTDFLPEEIKDKVFCTSCYYQDVDAVLVDYKELLEKAKAVNVYSSIQGAETGRIKRIEKPILVQDCDDREETLLRLAFFAAQKDYDTLVDVSIKSKKVGEGAYKKLVWSGTAVPVDPKVLK